MSTTKIFTGFLFLLLLASTEFLKAQNVNMGNFIKGKNNYDPQILGEDEARVYVLAEYSSGDWAIEAYDKKNKLAKLYSTPIEHEKINKKYKVEMEKVTYTNDKFHVFYSYYDSDEKKNNLFVSLFDHQTGKHLVKRQDIASMEVEKKSRRGEFHVINSEDRSKIFVYNEAYKKKQKKTFREYRLLNEKLEILFQKELDAEEEMPSDFLVDNDGSLYYLKLKDNAFIIGSFDANRDYEKWEEEVKIKWPEGMLTKAEEATGYIHNLKVNITKDNDLTITGLASLKADKKTSIVGAVYVRMDRESKEVMQAHIQKFSQEFLDQFQTAKDIKKNREGKLSYMFSREKVVDKEDGGLVMMLEEYFEYTYTDRYGRVVGRHAEFGSVIALNFDRKGHLLWANKIGKRQVFAWHSIALGFIGSTRGMRFFVPPSEWKTTRHFSYSTGIFNEKLVVIYNDNGKNMLQKSGNYKPAKFKKPEKAAVVKEEFDLTTGTRKKEMYTALLKAQTSFCMQSDYQKNQNSDLILFGIRKGKYNYCCISQK